ncbi:TetR/AcrR family transcriptional regulator [Specibacter sp. NPDC057265]|uniref:TetR/AcrR family transcriptional regulator n=1 Tax=Specibacter sp. NPDC057265 TaxID=3346075 RepID=UPI00363FC585
MSMTSEPRSRSAATAGPDAPTPAESNPVSEPAGARERQVHVAALGLFATQGLGAPLADIAKAAGVGVATLYRRYRDKDILILEVYRGQLDVMEKLAVQANDFPDAWSGLVHFLRRTTEHFAADRGLRELILGGYVGGVGWARRSTHKELIEALDLLERRVIAALEVLVTRAKEQGTVRSDFDATDVLLMSAMAHAPAPVKESGWPVRDKRALTLLLEGIRPPAPDGS